MIKPRGVDVLEAFGRHWALLIFHTALFSLSGCVSHQLSTPCQFDFSPHFLMWQNYTSESEPNSKIHPFETFRMSMDDHEYSEFESTIIRPSIRAACSRNALLASSSLTDLPIAFAPGRQSIIDTQRFLVDTDYNCPSANIRPPFPTQLTQMPRTPPLDRVFCVKGYFSEKQPGCFVWEGGYFEEGERVIFGTSGRIGHILRVCEVGKNYVMFKVEDLSSVSEGDVKM